jgi:hypothetical protein
MLSVRTVSMELESYCLPYAGFKFQGLRFIQINTGADFLEHFIW